MIPTPPTNETIATSLDEAAERLVELGANPHRVQAYRFAAQTVRHTERPLAELWRAGGVNALTGLPGIGDRLAERIAGFVETGRLSLLDALRVAPERLFTRVPGIGPELARRLHEVLGVETLEALELAAHDGRLDAVEGFGPGRVRTRTVALLLDVDRAYRRRSTQGALPCIAPRRFNPSGAAWLPILNTRRDGWHLTALFSNTARAHQLGKTDDWVVIYAVRDGHEVQHTVVIETRGALKDRRVVRGREAECADHHRTTHNQAA